MVNKSASQKTVAKKATKKAVKKVARKQAKGLGRGLSALLGDDVAITQVIRGDAPVETINKTSTQDASTNNAPAQTS